jgi:uncharacterized membrane protein
MIYEVLALIGITFTPLLELRASMPFGMLKTDINWMLVFIICVAANIVLAGAVYAATDFLTHHGLKIKPVRKLYFRTVRSAQKRLEPHIKKHGIWSLALFIGAPLPGSGVYTAGIGAHILGFNFKDYMIASVIGVIIAGIGVAAVVISGSHALQFLIRAV